MSPPRAGTRGVSASSTSRPTTASGAWPASQASGGAVLDPRLLREQPDRVEAGLLARRAAGPLAEYREADGRRRGLLQQADELKARRNRASETVAQARRRGEDAAAAIAESRRLGKEIDALDGELRAVEAEVAAFALRVPNLPHGTVPVGRSAEDNVEVRR